MTTEYKLSYAAAQINEKLGKIVDLDTTLTVEGAAADAKSTGVALNQLKDDIDNVNNTTENPAAAGKVWTSTNDGAGWADPQSGYDGVVEHLKTDKTLIIRDGILGVNTADVVEEDNTLPVTSAAVQVVVGNISAILDTI